VAGCGNSVYFAKEMWPKRRGFELKVRLLFRVLSQVFDWIDEISWLALADNFRTLDFQNPHPDIEYFLAGCSRTTGQSKNSSISTLTN